MSLAEETGQAGAGTSSSPARGAPAGSLLQAVAAAVALLLGLIGGYLVHGQTNSDPSPGPVDVGFTQDMIQHHQQAVTMGQLVAGRVSPQVNALAQLVASDQLREIGRMEGYLDLWDRPFLAETAPMSWMIGPGGHRGHGGTARAAMPGAATQDELNELGRATGPAADQLYLNLMIRHHHGAVVMADYAITGASTAQVRAFATAVAYHQREEIEGMSKLLAAVHT